MTNNEIKKEIDATINFLSKRKSTIDPVYIHFRPQIDFVFHDGIKKVDHLYTVEVIERMLFSINKITEGQVRSNCNIAGAKNENLVYRSGLTRKLVALAKPCMPNVVRKKLASQFRTALYVPRSQQLPKAFCSSYVHDFINSYYKEDFQLFEKVIKRG